MPLVPGDIHSIEGHTTERFHSSGSTKKRYWVRFMVRKWGPFEFFWDEDDYSPEKVKQTIRDKALELIDIEDFGG